jgi:hypothetical protein
MSYRRAIAAISPRYRRDTAALPNYSRRVPSDLFELGSEGSEGSEVSNPLSVNRSIIILVFYVLLLLLYYRYYLKQIHSISDRY